VPDTTPNRARAGRAGEQGAWHQKPGEQGAWHQKRLTKSSLRATKPPRTPRPPITTPFYAVNLLKCTHMEHPDGVPGTKSPRRPATQCLALFVQCLAPGPSTLAYGHTRRLVHDPKRHPAAY